MAIAKVIYKANSQATPEVWMDTTQKTVTSETMLNGTTALKNDGTDIAGYIASKSSSDLTISDKTVVVPAGYYSSEASKTVPVNLQSSTVDPSTSSQTVTPGYVETEIADISDQSVSRFQPHELTVDLSSFVNGDICHFSGKICEWDYSFRGTTTIDEVFTWSSSNSFHINGLNWDVVITSSQIVVSNTTSSYTYDAGYAYFLSPTKINKVSAQYDGLSSVTVTAMPSMTLPTSTDSSATSGYTSKATISRSTSDQYINIPTGYNAAGAYYKVNATPNMTLPTSTAASATSGYTSKATVSRSTSDQYINIPTGYNSSGAYYKISAVPNGSVTAPSTISGTSASVSAGTNTITLSKTVSVTPNVTTSGYISSGTAGNASVSLTANVNTRSSSDLTASGATVTAPSGYYASSASKSVASGTEGTPTASKGAVSNHSVTITPSVTNTAGYISGGTKTGTAVTVTAAELESGTKSIVENGTDIDVSGYSTVDVEVPSDEPVIESLTVTPTSSTQIIDNHYITETAVPVGTSFGPSQLGVNFYMTEDLASLLSSLIDGKTYYVTGTIGLSSGGGDIIVSGLWTADYKTGSGSSVYSLLPIAEYPSNVSNVQIDKIATSYYLCILFSSSPKSAQISSEITFKKVVDGYLPVTVNAMPSGSATTPSTSITANPFISVGSDGLITSSVSASQSVTPTVSAGYVSSGTAGTVSVSGSNTSQLTTQAAQTIYPSISDQTISSGKYLTGAQTIKGVLVSDTLTASNIANGVTVKIGDSADDDRIISVTGTLESGTHTATITQRDANVYGGVKVNNTGTSYEAVGTTFTFKYGDTLSVNARRNSGSGEVYVNGVLKGRGSASVKVRLPNGDIEIAFTNPSELSVSQTLITSSATFDPDVTKGFFERTEYYPILPQDATSIGNGMFYSYSSSLTTLTLPSGLERIGSYAFYNCSYLALTSLPNSIQYIDQYAFCGCTRLALTSLPSSLTNIGSYAFQRCSNLALTSLPSSLTYIGANAFYDCSQLAITSIPSTVSSIGNYAFYGCTSLNLTSFSPSSSYTSIGSYTFHSCTSLALTSLPSAITSIGSSAFYGCTSLALTSLPSGVTTIGDNAFRNCTSITVSSLPSSVTTIGVSAFSGCTGLTSISCSGTITSLAVYAFNGDSSLKTVSFPNMALTSNIGMVFGSTTVSSACQELETVDLGVTTGIASNAFANCYKLTKLILRRTSSIAPLGGTNAFTNTPMSGYNSLTGTVYVPSALISSYQTATNWKTLYNNGTITFTAIEGSEYEL